MMKKENYIEHQLNELGQEEIDGRGIRLLCTMFQV